MLDMSPARFRHWTVAAFGGWNLVVWLSRARNIVADDALSTGSKAAWMVPVAVFCATGVLCLVAWWRGRDFYALPIKVLAVFGALYWLVRTVQVLVGDESASFKAIHALLALVTIGLAGALIHRQRQVEMVPKGALL